MDYQKIADNFKKRDSEVRQQLEERVRLARGEIARLTARFIKDDPTLRKLYLFGSLAEDQVRNLNFDIDLAVDTDRYLDLIVIAEDSVIKVDLVELKNARSAIKKRILEKGQLLYAKE